MKRRRRIQRRFLWAGVLFGLVLLLAVVSVMRVALWSHDVIRGADRPVQGPRGRRYTAALS